MPDNPHIGPDFQRAFDAYIQRRNEQRAQANANEWVRNIVINPVGHWLFVDPPEPKTDQITLDFEDDGSWENLYEDE